MRLRLGVLLGLLVLSQAGCRAVPEAPSPSTGPPRATEPIPAGYTRYQVLPGESEIRVLVYRDGPMARLGHNHVLNTSALRGDIFLGEDGGSPRFALHLPVGSFSVDDATLRAEEGEEFPGTVAPDAIAGTRNNLLGSALLDAARFPEILLTARTIEGSAPDYRVLMAVELKGQVHDLQVPVHVEQAGDQLRVTGQFTTTHGDLGLRPFTAMGGLLSVRDEIRLRFRIVAHR